MNTIEQARDVAKCLRALMRDNEGSAYMIAADTIDELIAELEKVTIERDHANDVCDSYVAELASIKQQGPVGVVVRVDSAMAPGCSYLQGTMIKNTPDGALLYLAAGAQAVQQEPLFWYRPCSDGCYEGPISNSSIEEVRKRSGAWVPLVPLTKG